MKKVLFCAAFVAALSMAFVACGKKKTAEEQAAEALQNAAGLVDDAMQRAEQMAAPAPAYEAPAPAPATNNAALRERLVREFEAAVAAGDYDRAFRISMEAEQKVNPEDFTPDQVQRIMNAASLIPEEVVEKYNY